MKAKNKTKNRKKKKQKKLHSSLAFRISSFYNSMFATWLSLSLVVILVLVMLFTFLSMMDENQPSINHIEESNNISELIEQVNSIQAGRFAVIDQDRTLLASSLQYSEDDLSIPANPYIGLQRRNDRVYISFEKSLWIQGRDLILVIYNDISVFILEIVIIGAAAIGIFLISTGVVYLRGNYMTRKALGVLEELVVKANNISSQNLNLRLNVSDSTDELIELALTFNRMMNRIEKSYEKQNQFVSDASHELRTPIAVIQGYARMLERWGKDDKEILHESIQAINKESKNMQDLVDKLLFIARNDKDTLVLVKKEFNMSELMNELTRDTEMLETQHIIESNIEPDILLNGDRDRIKQALRIFVDNAIKYTEPGGKIILSLTKDDKYGIVTIKDTGKGIPEKDLSSIFDRFYQVDSSRKRENGGHGLGLSIAKIIVLRHGGRIKVASKEGVGTRFRIFLAK